MFRSIKRVLSAATVILAMSAPTAAYAAVEVSAASPSGSGQAELSIVPLASHATASSSPGFQWGDAGIGAVGVLVLAGAGSGAVLGIRRRAAHRPLAS